MQPIVDLVIERAVLVGYVLDLEPSAFAERHFKIGVQPVARIDADSCGNEREILLIGGRRAEKVAKRTFDARYRAVVPIDTQNGEASREGTGAPDVPDGALALDVRECEFGVRFQRDGWRDLPAATEITRAIFAGTVLRHTATATLACKIFRGNGAGFALRNVGKRG